MVDKKTTFILSPRKVIYFLAVITIFLVVAHVIGVLMRFVFGHNSVYGLVPFFDLDTEKNAPTFFSSLLFLINGLLFFIMWNLRKEDKQYWIWLLLSGICCFLSLDEFAEIHEQFAKPARFGLNFMPDLFEDAWVIPWGIAAIITVILMIPFFKRINKKIRHWFAWSVLVYISGAIFIELIGNWYVTTRPFNIICGFLIMIEEALEMTGLIMLIYTLLTLLQNTCNKLEINIPFTNSPVKQIIEN